MAKVQLTLRTNVCAIGFGLVLLVAGSACGQNVIYNGNFERGAYDKLPTGWKHISWIGGKKFETGKFDVGLSPDVNAGNGKKCLKITGSQISEKGKEMCRAGVQSRPFTWAPDMKYTIRFFYKTDVKKTQQGYAPAYIAIRGNVGAEWSEKWLKDTKGTWQMMTGVFRYVGPREEGSIQLRGYAEGDILFDEIIIEPAGKALVVEVDGKKYAVEEHEEKHPPAPLSDEDRNRGYTVFKRGDPAGIYPTSYPAPGELIQDLKTFATPGEYEPVDFALYPLKDLQQVRVEVSDLADEKGRVLSKDCIDVRSVKCWIQAAARSYKVVPELLDKTGPLDLKAKVPQQYWLTFHVPSDTPAGKYKGKITITPENGPSSEIMLGLRVLPFTLAETPYKFGCWVDISAMPGPLREKGRYSWEEIPVRFKDMKEHGMNSMVYDVPDSSFDPKMMGVRGSGKLDMDFSTDNKIVEMYKQAGFRGPIVVEFSKYTTNLSKFLQMNFPNSYYKGGNRGGHCQPPVDKTPPEYIEGYKEGIRQMYRNAKENDWPELIWHVNDEPAYQGMEVIKTAAAEYRWAKEATPEVRTWCVLKSNDEDLIRLFSPYVDILCNYVSSEEDYLLTTKLLAEGVYKERWGYIGPGNVETDAYESGRLDSGFKFKRTGMTGMFFWGYGFMGQGSTIAGPGNHLGAKNGQWDEYIDFPTSRSGASWGSKKIAFSYRSPKDPLEVVPTLAWEGVREGIDDVKYIVTLEGLIAEAKASGSKEARDEALSAQRMLKDMLAAIPWGVTDIDWATAVPVEPLSNEQMSKYRWQIALKIMKLSELLGR
ncbi:MAG: hypothetical protein GWP14_00305 [Actinobacteria bacterium]|nr:hypothetical protein [Actinomycetota bacterium]